MKDDNNAAPPPPVDTTKTLDDDVVHGMHTPDGFSGAEWDPSWYSTD